MLEEVGEFLMNRTVGVLALQGGFARHVSAIEFLGSRSIEVRTVKELQRCDSLIIPGGESTVLTKLLMQNGSGPNEGRPWIQGPLFTALQKFVLSQPVMGTCAGLIMLAKPCGDDRVVSLNILPVSILRNAYGRQKESFVKNIPLNFVSNKEILFPAIFIRAPQIIEIGNGVSVLASARNGTGGVDPVLVQYKNILGLTFHPELTPSDTRIHSYFLSMQA